MYSFLSSKKKKNALEEMDEATAAKIESELLKSCQPELVEGGINIKAAFY